MAFGTTTRRAKAKAKAKAKVWWPDLRTWPVRIAALVVIPMPVRKRMLEMVGHRFGPMARIRPGCLVTGSRLRVGRDTFINGGCLIDATGEIVLGDEVHVAHGVQILTADHRLGSARRRAGSMTVEPVSVGDGTWIGAGAILLPGVTVGAGCVVGAGAVVTSDLPADGLYGGVPARLIRDLTEPPADRP